MENTLIVMVPAVITDTFTQSYTWWFRSEKWYCVAGWKVLTFWRGSAINLRETRDLDSTFLSDVRNHPPNTVSHPWRCQSFTTNLRETRDLDSTFLSDVRNHPPNTVSHPWRRQSFTTNLWETRDLDSTFLSDVRNHPPNTVSHPWRCQSSNTLL